MGKVRLVFGRRHHRPCPVRAGVHIAVAAVVVAILGRSATAHARSVVTIDRDHADAVEVDAAVPVPAVPAGADVVVRFGMLPLRVPGDAIKRHGKLLSFEVGKGLAGLTSLRIDLRRGRVALRAQGLVLPVVAGPIALQVGTDDASGCAMLRAVPLRARRGSSVQRFRLARDVGACVLADAPRPAPGKVVTGVSTAVHFTADVPAGVDAGSAHVRVLDAVGKPTGAVLCAIADGTDGCDASLTETASGRVAVVVQATAKGRAIVSPVATLRAAPAATVADVDTLIAIQQQVQSLWTDAKGRLGDSLDARMATLAAARRLDGVADAALSVDEEDLVFRYTSGLLGELLLGTRFDGVPAATGAATPATAALLRRGAPATVAASGPCTQTREIVGNLKALIFDPGFFADSEAPAIADQLNQMTCLGFDVKLLSGADASVAGFLGAGDYSTMVLDTHGGVDWLGRVNFATADFVANVKSTYLSLFDTDLLTGASVDSPNNPPRALITSDLVERLTSMTVPNGFVWGGFCFSLANDTLALAFNHRGALTYYGFDRRVSTTFADQVGRALFTDLVPDFQTTGEAFAAISPKVDPYRLASDGGTSRGVGRTIVRPLKRVPARFLKSGGTGDPGADDLAYVGVAHLMPASASLQPGGQEDVTVSVERADTCDLLYHWHTSATVGDLANADGADDFDSSHTTATYTARSDVTQGGTDTLQVDVHPPGETGPAATQIASACGTVSVGSQMLPTTLEIVFDGSGTWSQTATPGVGHSVTFSASVDWHAVYQVSLPDFMPNSMQNAGPGTTVTGNSSISGAAGCSGPIVVNTSHGQGTPPPQAQTPFLIPLPSGSQTTKRFAIDAMGGYDYRLCDGQYNIGEGSWAPGSPDFPNYAGAPFFADITFDRAAFANAPPHTQQIPVGVTQHVTDADVSWSGTVTLTSKP